MRWTITIKDDAIIHRVGHNDEWDYFTVKKFTGCINYILYILVMILIVFNKFSRYLVQSILVLKFSGWQTLWLMTGWQLLWLIIGIGLVTIDEWNERN